MNSSGAVSSDGRRWWVLVAAIAVLPLMISNGSLWIDEAATAMHALQPNFSAWWTYLNYDKGGDALQPLGMFFSWVGGHYIGTSEWQLRSVNLLWGILSLYFIWLAGRNLNVTWLPLLFVVQPFFWFYTNEARPYAIENTCGAALLWSFTIFLRDHARGLRWCVSFTAAAVAFCYATALAPIFLGLLVLVGAVVVLQQRWKPEAKTLIVLLAGLIAVAPVGLYYLETFRRGVSSAQLYAVDARYFGYVAYDLCGDSGLGPPIDQLRQLARNFAHVLGDKQMLFHLLCAMSLFLCLGVLFLALLTNRKAGDRKKLALILAAPILLQTLTFFVIGLTTHKNFWPRHLNVAFPFYIAAIGVAIHWAIRSGNLVLKISAALLISLLLWSSLRLRYSPTYAKEDYRWAAATALQASRDHHAVWWVANEFGASYYGLKVISSKPGSGEAFSPEQARLTGRPPDSALPLLPDDIFVSRPDVHDASGSVRDLIRQNGYQLRATHPSFEWWTR